MSSAIDDELYAHAVLRIAWLRVHAELVTEVDPSGLLSAQLRDLADLLERDNGSARVAEDGRRCQ